VPRANTSSAVIKCLAPGTVVTLLEDIPYWQKVRLEAGREGWAAKKYLESVIAPPLGPQSPAIPAVAWLRIHFVDVGQGDAIWIQTYDDGIDGNGIFEGMNIVIDGGPDSADSRNVLLNYIE
jgi:hypothetical protein